MAHFSLCSSEYVPELNKNVIEWQYMFLKRNLCFQNTIKTKNIRKISIQNITLGN